jgi:hypothetical protein
MELRVIGWGDMDWIDLAEDKDQWRALGKFLLIWATGGSSRRTQLLVIS